VTPLPTGRLALITGAFGFVEAPLERVTEPYAALVAARLTIEPGALRRQSVPGPLAAALGRLEPLREGPGPGDRHLLAPTDGDWSAYFENAVPGDPRVAAAELPDRLGCRTLVLYAEPSDPEDSASPLSTVGFTLSGPGRAGMLDALRVLIIDAGDREPQTYGDPLPFEDTHPRDLGLELGWLDRYCRALGLRPFDQDFFFPPGTDGVLLATLSRPK